ncbi:hypothetical protein [Lacticaseibacillus saniviri]
MKKSGLMLLSLLGGLIASNMFGMAGQPVVAVTSTFTNEPVSALLPASESITPEKTDDNDDQEKNSEEAVDENAANETSESGTQPIVDEEQTPPKDEVSDSEEEVANEASDDETEASSDMARADEGQITEEVETEEELRAAFMNGNNIQLKNDITLKNTSSKLDSLVYSGITISGENGTTVPYTLTIDLKQRGESAGASSGDNPSAPLLFTAKVKDKRITFTNINIVNSNYWGVFPQISNNNTTIHFDNVNYHGPQLVHSPYGQVEFTGNNNITVNRHEVAEAKQMTFDGGSTKINHNATSAYPFLWPLHGDKTALKISNNAQVSIETVNYVFTTANAAYLDVSDNSTLNITAKGIYSDKPSIAAIKADSNSHIELNLSTGLGYTTSVVPLTATNESTIKIKTKDNTYGTASNSDFTAENNSKIEIQSEKAISSGVMSGKVTATENSNINLNAATQVFGTLSGAQIKVEKDARMNISGQQFAGNITGMQNTDLFTVAKKGTLTLKATDTLFKAVGSSGTVRYKIDGILNQTVGQMYGGTLGRTFDYHFNAGSKVNMTFTSTSSKKNLQFAGDSTMTIGDGAKVVLSNLGNTAPIVSGDNSAKNVITINRAHLELNRSKVGDKDSPHFEKVKMVLPDQCFRQIQITDLSGNQQKYPYINFEANQNGSTLTTTGNNDSFNANFNNQLKQLIITDVARPVVNPDPLEVQLDQKIFEVEGTATPGTELRLKFIGTDGGELVTPGEGRDLTLTTGRDGKFSFDIILDEALSTDAEKVNFAIIIEANYPEPDQLAWPVTAYVKQYDPAIVEFDSVPETLDFGTQNLTDINKDTQPLVEGDFVIEDKRTGEDRVGFSVMVRQNKTFTSETTGHQLKNSLWKRPMFLADPNNPDAGTEGEYQITDSDSVFVTVAADSYDTKLIDLTANLKGGISEGRYVPGMIQANFSGEPKVTGEKYVAELKWTLLNAPPNE